MSTNRPDYAAWPDLITYFQSLIAASQTAVKTDDALADGYFDTLDFKRFTAQDSKSKEWYSSADVNAAEVLGCGPVKDIKELVGEMVSVMLQEIECEREAFREVFESVKESRRVELELRKLLHWCKGGLRF